MALSEPGMSNNLEEFMVSLALTRDTSTNQYAALKIYAHDLVAEDEIGNETAMYNVSSLWGTPTTQARCMSALSRILSLLRVEQGIPITV